MDSLDQGAPQSSVSHTLKELMEEGLVVKKGKSYSLSNVGIIERNTMEWMGRTLGCLKDHRDFIQSHDLYGIPPGFQVTIGVFCDGREIIENDPPSQTASTRRSSSRCWRRLEASWWPHQPLYPSSSSQRLGQSERAEASRPSQPRGSSRSCG